MHTRLIRTVAGWPDCASATFVCPKSYCWLWTQWHLGFETFDYHPLGRGFDSYYGYLGGGEDYFSHMSGGYVDLHDNNASVFNANGSYSATLFANKTIDVVQAHAASGSVAPLFIYLAFQSIHSPIQAPEEWVQPYSWIMENSRRTMAGMASCMDAEIARVADAMKEASFWDDTLFVFAADNGGPPYVANSNYPMYDEPKPSASCFLLCSFDNLPSRVHVTV